MSDIVSHLGKIYDHTFRHSSLLKEKLNTNMIKHLHQSSSIVAEEKLMLETLSDYGVML